MSACQSSYPKELDLPRPQICFQQTPRARIVRKGLRIDARSGKDY